MLLFLKEKGGAAGLDLQGKGEITWQTKRW